jgi:ribonuclease P protein component
MQFQTVFRRGKSMANPRLVLLYLRRPELKIGISVSKKVGGAVARNLVKRRIREALRPQLAKLRRGHYVFVARAGSAEASFQELSRALIQLLRRQELFLPEEGGAHR